MKFICRYCGNEIELVEWEGMITFSHIDAVMTSGHIFSCPDGEHLAHPAAETVDRLKLMVEIEEFWAMKEGAR